MNAANEEAVFAFLDNKIKLGEIFKLTLSDGSLKCEVKEQGNV